MKLLFQGDSITDAFRKPEERNPAFQLGNGYVFLIAARLGRDYPGAPLEFENRGVSGNDINHLRERWEADALALRPDLLTILNGINDTVRAKSSEVSPESVIRRIDDGEFLRVYRGLLSAMRAANPQVALIIMEPYLLETGTVTREWVEHLRPRQQALREVAEEFGAVFVPLQSCFDAAIAKAPAEFWAYDGVHATHAGFQLIADAWLAAARPWLARRLGG